MNPEKDPYETSRTLANAWCMYRDLIQAVERFNIKDVGRYCWSDYTRDNVYQMEDIAIDTISRCRDEQSKILKRYKELFGKDLGV